MHIFKKRYCNFGSLIDFLIVSTSLLAILIPLRIISKEIFQGEIFGTLGLVTCVLGLILFLSKKEKLGKFGTIFIRQITKNHSRKNKWLIYIQTAIFLSIGILTIFFIHMGNNEYELKEQIITELYNQGVTETTLNFDMMNQISSQIHPTQQIEVISALPILVIKNFKIFSTVLSIANDLMEGWVMYFWQVMVIETIEVIVFLSVTRKLFLKSKNHSKS